MTNSTNDNDEMIQIGYECGLTQYAHLVEHLARPLISKMLQDCFADNEALTSKAYKMILAYEISNFIQGYARGLQDKCVTDGPAPRIDPDPTLN